MKNKSGWSATAPVADLRRFKDRNKSRPANKLALVTRASADLAGKLACVRVDPVVCEMGEWGRLMTWVSKYWGVLANLYWTPKYLGLRSISKSVWKEEEDFILIPRASISKGGSKYILETAIGFQMTRI